MFDVFFIIALCALTHCVLQIESRVHSPQRETGEHQEGLLLEPNIPDTEMQALSDLYYSTDGPNWLWNNSAAGIPWDFTPTANPCVDDWEGVTCTEIPPYTVLTILLDVKGMDGTLPETLDLLTNLVSLHITSNLNLRGPLPECIARLPVLRTLALQSNGLTGTIPESWGNMSQLVSIGLFENYHLNGTLPASLGNWASMEHLDIAWNRFEGTIPPSWSGMTKLVQFAMNDNRLHGTLPTFICAMTSLGQFALQTNGFFGTIPSCYANFTAMQGFYVDVNQLSGTIPEFFGTFSQLISLNLYSNNFRGTIPPVLGALKHLENLNLYNNKLTGTIPTELSGLRSAQYLVFNNNSLRGTIPPEFGQLRFLQELGLQLNELTGTIPSTLGNCSNLEILLLNDNQLEGTIPTELAGLTRLSELFLQNNFLQGSLQGVVNASQQKALNIIQVSGNHLTGEIPLEIYRLPHLSTFAAVSNCFEGSLPSILCSCDTLATLVLDGLHAASTCQQKILPGLSQSYAIEQPLTGGVLACLFAMPKLATLHLSGNGLTGTLPDIATISASLVDLALSHNRLSGSIPAAFQRRQWYNLDLSYNRFSGTLASDFASQPLPNVTDPQDALALSLENNRLSGDIPGSISNWRNISILGSNLFYCNAAGSNLPQHDSGRDEYQCPSSSFDAPYYLWLSLLACALLPLCVYACRKYGAVSAYLPGEGALALATQWLDTANTTTNTVSTGSTANAAGTIATSSAVVVDVSARLQSFRAVTSLFKELCFVSAGATAYILAVLMPAYAILSYLYSTVTYQYIWTVSCTYMSGGVGLGVVMALLLVLLCIVFALSRRSERAALADASRVLSTDTVASQTSAVPLVKRIAVYGLFMVVNFTVAIGVNIAYVYVALYESRALLLFAQIVLSLFKLFWNKYCATFIVRWSTNYLSSVAEAGLLIHGKEFMSVQLFVTLTNTVAIPCVVVAIISPNCFKNVFFAAPTVHSTYKYFVCTFIHAGDELCDSPTAELGQTSFSPPFDYSFQCSSSFVTYYAPAFIFLCVTATFLTPATEIAALWMHKRVTRGTTAYRLLNNFLPRILRPVNPNFGKTVKRNKFRPYFDADRIVISLEMCLGILLTFGAVFPPLAAAMCVTIVSVAYYSRLKAGRLLRSAIEQGVFHYVDTIEAECRGVASREVLHSAMWMLITISCWFYTLFLFDTLGAVSGFDGAYWVLIVMPLLPVFAYLLVTAYQRWHSRGSAIDTSGGAHSEVSLNPLVSATTLTSNNMESMELQLNQLDDESL